MGKHGAGVTRPPARITVSRWQQPPGGRGGHRQAHPGGRECRGPATAAGSAARATTAAAAASAAEAARAVRTAWHPRHRPDVVAGLECCRLYANTVLCTLRTLYRLASSSIYHNDAGAQDKCAKKTITVHTTCPVFCTSSWRMERMAASAPTGPWCWSRRADAANRRLRHG